MDIFALSAALLAALFWAAGTILVHEPLRYYGVIRFLEIQLPAISLFLFIMVFFYGGWGTIDLEEDWLLYVASALIGVLLGDFAFMKCISAGGPRRAQLLFTLNAPVAALIGYYLYGEVIGFKDLIGAAILLFGLSVAIWLNKQKEDESSLEQVDGKISLVVFWGCLAAICQASGLLLMKPVLVAGADPVAVATLRAAICAFVIVFVGQVYRRRYVPPFHMGNFIKSCVSGIMGYAIAMGLLLYALRSAQVGLVSTLAATTPILMLPLLWMVTKKAPQPAAWFGAGLAVIGVAILSWQ